MNAPDEAPIRRDAYWVNRRVLEHLLVLYDDPDVYPPFDERELSDLMREFNLKLPEGLLSIDVENFVRHLGTCNFRLIFPCHGDFVVVA